MKNIFTGIKVMLSIWLICLHSFMESYSQDKSKITSVAGDYHLTGVMETASGFRLNPDSTFNFYYSYGAIDREGEGTWSVIHDSIILNSKQRPESDFKLIESRKEPGEKIILSVTDPNRMLLPYVQFLVNPGAAEVAVQTDQQGIAFATVKTLEKLGILFELCPDRPSYFTNTNPAHNYFQFGFQPWICGVFFNNYKYAMVNGNLAGPHPLLADKKYIFKRNSND